MKTVAGWVFALALLIVIVADRRAASAELGAMKAKLDSANAVRVVDSVEVVRTVTKTQTLRDSVLLLKHDTTLIERYVKETDTLRIACMACIASASQVSVAAESIYVAAKPRFRDRFGVTLGYGITKVGPDVKVGPQLGVSVRLW